MENAIRDWRGRAYLPGPVPSDRTRMFRLALAAMAAISPLQYGFAALLAREGAGLTLLAAWIAAQAAGALPALFNSFDQTLIHNDSHQGNMAFGADRALLLDWQACCIGSALKDFAYFLATADSAMRRANERELLQHYLDVLSAGDGPVISWEEAWTAYRILAVTGFIAAAATALAGDRLQNAANATAGLERAATTLIDLESFKAVQQRLAA